MADTIEATIVHTVEVVRYDDPVITTERVAVSAFIAGYTDPTRRSYATDLRIFAAWCHDHGINLLNVKRPHLETFARWMEQEGRMASTIGRRLSTLSSFYKYCQIEDILDKNPALNVRGPKVHDESRTLGLDRNELGALLVQAGLGDSRDGALMTLLGLNGLRISEALNADIDDLSTERGHRTLAIVRKGGKHVTIPIAPRTGRALDLYIGERTMGPIFLGVEGGRMNRYCADRMVKRLVKRAGIDKRISPHTCGTRSSPPLSMPASHCATSKKPHHTPTRERRCATTVPGAASTGTPRTSCRPSSPVRRVRVEPLDINYSTFVSVCNTLRCG